MEAWLVLLELPFLLLATIFSFLTARRTKNSLVGNGMVFIATGSLIMASGHVIMIVDGILQQHILADVFGKASGASAWLLALSSSWLLYGFGFYKIYQDLPGKERALYEAITKQRRAAEALSLSEQRYRRLIETARDVIYTISPQGIITSLNPAFEVFTGWPCSEWIGKPFAPLVCPEDLPLAMAMFERTMAGEQPPLFTVKIFDQWGAYRVGEFFQTVQTDENGIAVGLLGVGRDVSDRVKIEEALKKAHDELERRVLERTLALSKVNDELEGRTKALEASEERLQQSLLTLHHTLEDLRYQKSLLESQSEAAIDGILVMSSRGEVLSFNSRFAEMWDVAKSLFQKGESGFLLRKLEALVVNPEQLMKEVPTLSDSTPQVHEQPQDIELKDGRLFEQYSAPIKDAGEVVYGRIWYFRDITKRRQSEEALRESEQRFRSVTESATDAIITADWNGRILSWNLGAQIIFGYRAAEVIGNSLTCLMPERFRESHTNALERVRTAGESTFVGRTLEMYGVHKDGTEFPLEISLAIWRGMKGTFFSGIVRDLTDRKRAEAARARLVAVLFGEFERRHIARELHDQIGQALTALRITLEMVQRVPAESPLVKLNEAVVMVDDLIKRVQALSLDLRPPMLDDLGLLAALLWQVQQYSARSGIQVEFEHAGLERRFGQAIETAAYRTVQESLTNVARHAGVREARVRVFANERTLSVDVEDHGRGFDAERAHSIATFGLTGMRERVSALGGQLTIESAPNRGTRISMEIPLAEKVPPALEIADGA
ncbi:PAS domain S-box protein [Nitrospira sp. Nam80]